MKKRKDIPKVKILKCYKCAGDVTSEDAACPHCGATASSFNPSWVLRVAIGFMLGFLIWLIFWAA